MTARWVPSFGTLNDLFVVLDQSRIYFLPSAFHKENVVLRNGLIASGSVKDSKAL